MGKVKMCCFCKNELSDTGSCRYCGTVVYNGFSTLMCRENFSTVETAVALTDRYLMLQNNRSGGMATVGAMSFGALGAVVGGLVDSAIHSSEKSCIGIYDLREIESVYNPYPLKGRKKELVFRFVNLDKTDFVLTFKKQEARRFAEVLRRLGFFLIDASSQPVNKFCCEKPFVDKKTFDKRICSSAGGFVHLVKGQFVAPPMATKNAGTVFRKRCVRCGCMNPPGAGFCAQCGSALGSY